MLQQFRSVLRKRATFVSHAAKIMPKKCAQESKDCFKASKKEKSKLAIVKQSKTHSILEK